MRFPTMWYVRPAKDQTSLRIRTALSEHLLVKMPHCWKSRAVAEISSVIGHIVVYRARQGCCDVPWFYYH